MAEESVLARAQARLGSVLRGKYRLDRVLGVGGMATVYAATHRNGKEFAVKLLHPDLSFQGDMRSRFLREGYLANSVKHSGAVTVLDDDVTEDGSAFIVMELLEGRTVEALWDKYGRRMELPAVVAIGVQLLDVLAAAHAHNVIHRDIKPANLFITKAGQLKVLDFGIARIRDLASSFAATQSGFTLGTPAFMAPEQASGKVSEISPQTDIWSAGATLFTLASGRLVHEAESQHELLIAAAMTPARPLASVLPGVPPLIAEIIDRATPYAVGDRWANATAMREALRHAAIAVFGNAPVADDLVAALDARSSERTLPVEGVSGPIKSMPAPASPLRSGYPQYAPMGQPGQAAMSARTPPPVSHPPVSGQPVSGHPVMRPAAAMTPPPGGPGAVITAQPVYRSNNAQTAKPGSAGVVVMIIAAVVLIGGGVTTAVLTHHPTPRVAEVEASTETLPAAGGTGTTSAPEPVPPPTATAAPQPTPSAPTPPEPTATATATATAEPTATATATAAPTTTAAPTATVAPTATATATATGTATTRPTATSRPKVSCNPPYVVDAQGVKKWKRECL